MQTIISSAPRRSGYSAGLDVVRALLAFRVLIAHLVPWTVMTQGEGAVPGWLNALMASLIRTF